MALALSKNSNRGTVGLDLDGAFIAAVQTSSDGVTRAASVELAPGVISDGEVTDVAALTEALRDFFKAEALPKRVRLGIGNQQIVVRQMEIPKIDDDKERAAAVRFQASEAIAMPLDEVVLDHQVVGEGVSPEGSGRLRVVVVAARESMIARVVEAVRGAGLRPEGIDLNAFALVRTLAVPSDSTETARVFCHLGGVTNLAIAVGTSCLFTRPLSTEWDSDDGNVAAALAEVSQTSLGSTRARPRVSRSQSMRPVASPRTDWTRCSLTLLKSPYGASALARAWAAAVSALAVATWVLRELIALTVRT